MRTLRLLAHKRMRWLPDPPVGRSFRHRKIHTLAGEARAGRLQQHGFAFMKKRQPMASLQRGEGR